MPASDGSGGRLVRAKRRKREGDYKAIKHSDRSGRAIGFSTTSRGKINPATRALSDFSLLAHEARGRPLTRKLCKEERQTDLVPVCLSAHVVKKGRARTQGAAPCLHGVWLVRYTRPHSNSAICTSARRPEKKTGKHSLFLFQRPVRKIRRDYAVFHEVCSRKVRKARRFPDTEKIELTFPSRHSTRSDVRTPGSPDAS